MRYLRLSQKVLVSHCNLSQIIDICNIRNSDYHRIKIINIMRCTRLIENINRWRGFSLVTDNLMIGQSSSISLLYLWVHSYKLSILIWSRGLAIILVAAIRKTSHMVCIIKELLMSLMRSWIVHLQLLLIAIILLDSSLLLNLSWSILIFWNVSVCWLSCIHL